MNATPSKKSPKPGKFTHFIFCFLPLFLFVLLGLGLYLRGYWMTLPLGFLLVIVPLLDTITGWQSDGDFEKEDFSLFQTFLLSWNTRLYVLLYMASLIYIAR